VARSSDGLVKIGQDNFSAGAFRSVARHLIPRSGVYTTLNGLYDEDGSIYRRGGSEYQSNGGLGAAGLRFIWDGQLAAGARTLVASATKFGVLDVDDATIIDIGGSGLAGPTRATVVGGIVFLGGGTMWAGSKKAADYSAGTVTVTQGSKVVTGAGTAWLANVDPGMLLRVGGNQEYHVVASVDSNTQITLAEPYVYGGGAGASYVASRFGTAANHFPGTAPALGAPNAEIYATIFNRLLAAFGDTLAFSDGLGSAAPIIGEFQTYSFPATNRHKMPGGVQILGVEPLRDTTLVFTTGGLYTVTGMAFNLVDFSGNVQQRLELANRDLILWAKEGVATYGNLLVVPCVDGVYTIGVAQGPELLSKSIALLYQSYVRAGYKPGLATVYKAHYSLPILDASNVVVDTLVCRLDRPIKTEIGTVYPWSFMAGHGGNVTGFATRVGGASGARSPQLLAASRATGSRILKLGGWWEPTTARKNDADGTTHEWQVEGRDDATGPGNENTIRKLKVWYELIDAGSDNPKITALYSKGSEVPGLPHLGSVLFGSFTLAGPDVEFLTADGQAPEDTGRNPFTWLITASSRFIRWKLICQAPCAKLVLRSTEWSVRPSGKLR
jgi:hypothetical protein